MELSIRPSTHFSYTIRESLLLMGFSSSSVEAAVQEKGESIDDCLQFLLQLPSNSINQENQTETDCSLPDLHENQQIAMDCQLDKDFFSYDNQLYGDTDLLHILDIRVFEWILNN